MIEWTSEAGEVEATGWTDSRKRLTRLSVDLEDRGGAKRSLWMLPHEGGEWRKSWDDGDAVHVVAAKPDGSELLVAYAWTRAQAGGGEADPSEGREEWRLAPVIRRGKQ